VRWLLALLAAGMLATLALAGSLRPDPSGMGTHEQIPGFGPCTARVLWGIPCPVCGMTTSWSHAVKGQLLPALRASASGTLLALVALALSVWFLASAWRGAWRWIEPAPWPVTWVILAVMGLVLLEWMLRRLEDWYA
jgi:hypothetical protein